MQIIFLNKALQRFESRVVVPTQFVSFTISAITGSAILYRDFEDVQIGKVVAFCEHPHHGLQWPSKADACWKSLAVLLCLSESSSLRVRDSPSPSKDREETHLNQQ